MRRRFRVLGTVVLLAGCAHRAGTRDVAAVFRLPKDTFCVGEPIVIEFTVNNGSSSTLVFEEGGDYRGILRHEQYSFRVVNTEGRDFTRVLLGSLGGEVDEIRLEPGQWFRSWQLLNSWVHLLPSGRYRVHCERMLRAGLDERDGPTFRQDLSFEVVPYSKDRIVSTIAALRRLEEDLMKQEMSAQDGRIPGSGQARCVDVPVDWAIDDLGDKLGIPDDDIPDALPGTWDDRYYIEYAFETDYGWLTTPERKEWQLTISARNNHTIDLPHRLADSTFTVNGVPVANWPESVKRMLAEKKLGDTLAPGSVAELSAKFLLTANGGKLEIGGTDLEIEKLPATITWTIRGVEMTPGVLFVR